MATLSLDRGYRSLSLIDSVHRSTWHLFWVILLLLGGASILLALLPSAWIRLVSRAGPENADISSLPGTLFGCFAALAYMATVGAGLIRFQSSLQLAISLCPSCTLGAAVAPSLVSVAFILAPLDAAVYASFGALLGLLLVAVRNLAFSADAAPTPLSK